MHEWLQSGQSLVTPSKHTFVDVDCLCNSDVTEMVFESPPVQPDVIVLVGEHNEHP